MDKKITPLKAVRNFCFDCQKSYRAIKNCKQEKCHLWIFRFGHNPARKGKNGSISGLSPYKKKVRDSVTELTSNFGCLND